MIQINEADAVRRVMELIALRGGSREEGQVSVAIQKSLLSAGIPASRIAIDTAHRRSFAGGSTGNLIVRLRGTRREPRRLLMAHMDTVPLAVESEPVRRGDWILSKSRTTALGGDNRAGCAVVLTAAIELLRQKVSHPPLTLLFTVQEEIGLCGARHVAVGRLGRPQLCFNWDGREPGCLITGAVGATNLSIRINGIASHAGVHPADGVNAAVVASVAVAELQAGGWHGQVVKGRGRGTSNIGVMCGGAATNVVMPEIKLQGEARSHSPSFRDRIVREFRKAFEHAVSSVDSSDGSTAQLTFEEDTRYTAFRIPRSSPCVRTAVAAVRAAGLTPETPVSSGGLDANWMTVHGFPTVTLGCGQHQIHTVGERLSIPQYIQACSIAADIAAGIE